MTFYESKIRRRAATGYSAADYEAAQIAAEAFMAAYAKARTGTDADALFEMAAEMSPLSKEFVWSVSMDAFTKAASGA